MKARMPSVTFPRWLKLLFVGLAAGLGAFLPWLAISMLPTAQQPTMLLCLSAASFGLLAAFFLFAPRSWRREKTRRKWGLRLCALACVAFLVTFACELFVCNQRAFATRQCEPYALDLGEFMTPDGEYAADEEGLLRFHAAAGETVTFQLEELYEETVAIEVSLSGRNRPVEVAVSLRDDASMLQYALACSFPCLPGTDGLNRFVGALYSNGGLNALQIQLTPEIEGDYELAEVTLNPNAPLCWQPLRMGLGFAALLLLLCALRFPWADVAYDRRRLWHRAVILVPMLLCMLLCVWIAGAILPGSTPGNHEADEGLFQGVSYEFAQTNKWDCYGMLMCAFNEGRLSLEIEPEEELTGLSNPYDPSQREDAQCNLVYDCALYEGSFYVYFGMAPVLLVYFPFYWLTGRVPSEVGCALLLALAAIALLYLATMTFARKYAKRSNPFLLSLCCLAVTCASGIFLLLSSADRYHNVILCCMGTMAGALWLGLSACMEKPGWKRGLRFALSGLFFALQGMSRANTLFLTVAFLAPAYVRVLLNREARPRQRLGDALCFLLPALAGVGVVMWYNYARFGSVSEFGQAFQITTEDIHYNVFRWEYLPQTLYHFFLDLPATRPVFPYIELRDSFINLSGNFFYTRVSLGMLAFPLMWLLPAMGLCFQKCRATDAPALRRERKAAFTLPLLAALPLMAVTFYFAGVTVRYLFDFAFSYALVAGCIGVLLFDAGGERSPEARFMRGAVVAALLLTVLLGVLLIFDNHRNNIYNSAPGIYYALVRMLPPYFI